jgi:hypothetical protein
MKDSGRNLGAVGLLVALLASPAWAADTASSRGGAVNPAGKPAARSEGVARPAASAPAAQGPAVSAGARSMGPDELARVGRQVEATPATTIYQATLKDGTLELSDRPPSGDATGIERRSYALPQDSTARQRAEAEREYWSRQAEAFERRRTARDRASAQGERLRPAPPVVILQSDWRRGVYHGYGWMPPDLYGVSGGFGSFGAPGALVVGGFAPTYTSSPGAVQGRDAGFIGSGFGMRR